MGDSRFEILIRRILQILTRTSIAAIEFNVKDQFRFETRLDVENDLKDVICS